MISIAICDDEGIFGQDLKEFVSRYMKYKGILYQIDLFGEEDELVFLGIGMIKYTIVFLVIDMKEMKGVMTAKAIRNVSKDIFIVFVAECADYALEGYKVDVIRYLLKNDTDFQSAIDECLDAIIDEMNYKVLEREFKFNEGIKKVSLERLLYIESRLHKLEFHIMEDDMKLYTLYETLNKVEKELDGVGFIRIHQSFLVNLKYIKNVLRYKAVLNNGMELAIPKARYNRVKEAFDAYYYKI